MKQFALLSIFALAFISEGVRVVPGKWPGHFSVNVLPVLVAQLSDSGVNRRLFLFLNTHPPNPPQANPNPSSTTQNVLPGNASASAVPSTEANPFEFQAIRIQH